MHGHSIEVRINAEDPEKGFRPSPGKIGKIHFPGGPGIRIDSYIYPGYTIPSQYDSLIVKLIVHGRDRKEAISRMKRALDEIFIENIKTTIPLFKKILEKEEFIKGEFDTHFLERIK
jgi:acetyl-CoA carboxylase biotin carboxylase subunit